MRPSPATIQNTGVNGRTTLRYALQTEVAFSWCGSDGSSRNGRGKTRNLSQKGAFVECSTLPPNGVSVQMSISLPPPIEKGKSLKMEARGRVVRVEAGGERPGPHEVGPGFAVCNDQVNLCAS